MKKIKNIIIVKKAKLTLRDFIKFLKENSAISLAIAVITGNAVSQFVSSLVTGIITPALEIILPKGNYESYTIKILGSNFLLGKVLSAAINLFIILTIVYVTAKFIMKDDEIIEKAKLKK